MKKRVIVAACLLSAPFVAYLALTTVFKVSNPVYHGSECFFIPNNSSSIRIVDGEGDFDYFSTRRSHFFQSAGNFFVILETEAKMLRIFDSASLKGWSIPVRTSRADKISTSSKGVLLAGGELVNWPTAYAESHSIEEGVRSREMNAPYSKFVFKNGDEIRAAGPAPAGSSCVIFLKATGETFRIAPLACGVYGRPYRSTQTLSTELKRWLVSLGFKKIEPMLPYLPWP